MSQRSTRRTGPRGGWLAFVAAFGAVTSCAAGQMQRLTSGGAFDCAPFAFRDVGADHKTVALRWAEPRKIRRVGSTEVKLRWWGRRAASRGETPSTV